MASSELKVITSPSFPTPYQGQPHMIQEHQCMNPHSGFETLEGYSVEFQASAQQPQGKVTRTGICPGDTLRFDMDIAW